MKYLVKTVVPATVVRVFEVEATNEEEALAFYLQGEAFELIEKSKTTTHDDDVEFIIDEE
jgi:calcineurin-like phosphoesterase